MLELYIGGEKWEELYLSATDLRCQWMECQRKWRSKHCAAHSLKRRSFVLRASNLPLQESKTMEFKILTRRNSITGIGVTLWTLKLIYTFSNVLRSYPTSKTFFTCWSCVFSQGIYVWLNSVRIRRNFTSPLRHSKITWDCVTCQLSLLSIFMFDWIV